MLLCHDSVSCTAARALFILVLKLRSSSVNSLCKRESILLPMALFSWEMLIKIFNGSSSVSGLKGDSRLTGEWAEVVWGREEGVRGVG